MCVSDSIRETKIFETMKVNGSGKFCIFGRTGIIGMGFVGCLLVNNVAIKGLNLCRPLHVAASR